MNRVSMGLLDFFVVLNAIAFKGIVEGMVSIGRYKWARSGFRKRMGQIQIRPLKSVD